MKTIKCGWLIVSIILVALTVIFSVTLFAPKTAASKTELVEVKQIAPIEAATSSVKEIKKAPVAAPIIPQVLLDIAYCESGGRQFYADGSLVIGKVDHADTGKFQINKRFHLKTATKMGLNLDTEAGNTAYALFLYKTQGTRPWLASKSCWSNIRAWKSNRKTYY